MQGKKVGHYEIVSQLGAGGMGAVYRARDLLLEREVAIKALPPTETDDQSLRARFLREARTASGLNHPNIITIFDVVQEDGSDYLVMELVEGQPLHALIPESGLDLSTTVAIAMQIGEALAAAHAAGVVHRDLKPANVMVRPDGRVKVLDFGLAKWVDERSEESRATELTQAGQVIGTVSYMSPEQVRGEKVDQRSDIFSLGVVIYQMLTATRPFEGTSMVQTLHAIGFEDPQPLTELRRDAKELAPIVDHALAKDIGERFQSMEELIDALREHQAGKTHEFAAQAQATQIFAAAEPERGPRRWLPLAIAGLLVAIFLVLPQTRNLLFDSGEPASERPTLETAFDRYSYGRDLLDHYYREGAIDEALQVLQGAVEADPEHAPSYTALAEAYWRKFRDEFDRSWLDRALAQAQQAVSLDPQLTSARAMRGLVQQALGEDELARADFDSTLMLDPNNAKAWRGIGDLALSAGDSAGAYDALSQAAKLDPEDQELPGRLGVLFYIHGDYTRSAEAFAKSAEIAPDNFGAFRNLGAAQHMLGDYGAAAASMQQALAIRQDASVYTNLGTLYFFQGLYSQAKAALETARSLGPNEYLVWGNLGDVYRFLPEHEAEAQQAFVRAHQLVRDAIEAHPEDMWLRGLSAEYLAKQGQSELAREELRTLAEAEDLSADSWYDMAQAWEALGERDEALAALDEALSSGYGVIEIKNDPELAELRKDVRYHQLMIPYDGPNEDGR